MRRVAARWAAVVPEAEAEAEVDVAETEVALSLVIKAGGAGGGNGTGGTAAAVMAGGGRDGGAIADALSDGIAVAAAETGDEATVDDSAAPQKRELRAGLSGDAAPATNAVSARPAIGMVRL